jgi:signal transduction histidine kinase
MSKIQTGSFETKFENILLVEDVLDDVIMEFYSRAKEKGLELIFENSSTNDSIYCDKYSVGQIFVNLVGNAIKYTEQGLIKINVCNEGDYLLVNIEDTGKGISTEYLPKIFEPFSQEDTGYTRRFEGTGLGLALVKKYTELNNASISVKSKVDKGSVFSIKFSLAN